MKKNNKKATSLETGLNAWGEQEGKFRSLFGKEALRDRAFLKMKLRHYDNLWYKYKNAPLDEDGKLMKKMLKLQRKKLEKSLHRGLGRRMVRRISKITRSRRVRNSQKKEEKRISMNQYTQSNPKPDMLVTAQKTTAGQKTMKRVRRGLSTSQHKTRKMRQNSVFHHGHFHRPKRGRGKGLHR